MNMTARLAGNFQRHGLIGRGKLVYALLGSPHNSSGVAFCLFDILCPDGQDNFKFVPGVAEMRPLQSDGVTALCGHICMVFCACIFEVPFYNFPSYPVLSVKLQL